MDTSSLNSGVMPRESFLSSGTWEWTINVIGTIATFGVATVLFNNRNDGNIKNKNNIYNVLNFCYIDFIMCIFSNFI